MMFLGLLIGVESKGQQPILPSAMDVRIIGRSSEEWNGSIWLEKDSLTYTYSGNRGSQLGFSTVFSWILVDNKPDIATAYRFSGGIWEKTVLTENIYDSDNKISSEVLKQWDGTAWVELNRHTYIYNAQGQLLVDLQVTTSGGTYQNRITNTYDSNGNLLESIEEFLDGQQWIGLYRTTNTYTNNRLTTSTKEEYISNWEGQYRETYSYDANGNTIEIMRENWHSGGWENFRKYITTYNSSNKPLTIVRQYYDNNMWVNSSRTTMTYNGLGLLSLTVEDYNTAGANWENETKHEYQLDGTGRVTQEEKFVWNGAWANSKRYLYQYGQNNYVSLYNVYTWVGSWEETERITTIFNSDNHPSSYEFMQNDNGSLQNAFREFFYYEPYNNGTNGLSSIPTLSSTVLPNPFAINVAIQLNVAEAGNHTLEVYNLAGQRVHSESRHLVPGQQTLVWEGSEVPKGVYFYKINSQSGVASGKLVKQ